MIEQGEAGDEVRFVLHELNDSGYMGVVYFGNEGEQTEVNVVVIEPAAME